MKPKTCLRGLHDWSTWIFLEEKGCVQRECYVCNSVETRILSPEWLRFDRVASEWLREQPIENKEDLVVALDEILQFTKTTLRRDE